MAMTPEERRIAKNEASKRWYAKHKAAKTAGAKPERHNVKTEDATEKQLPLEENSKDVPVHTENEPERVAERSNYADELQDSKDDLDDNDKDDLDDNDKDDLDDNEDEDYWAEGREEMFRELDAQGYMEED